MTAYCSNALPSGIRMHAVDNGNGLTMNVLEAGSDARNAPCVLLLHGFPEIAYSWRRVMPALADAGYRVIAPDQRGYGLTTGWDDRYDGDLASFRMFNLVRDVLGLLAALNIDHVEAVVGHDFGSHVAGTATLLRPDIFRAVALMSAPFTGPPPPPINAPGTKAAWAAMDAALAALPRPRKHYQRFYALPEANDDMWHCPQGVHDFLRAYFHFKSADWSGNQPHELAGRGAEAWAELPTYYIMDLASGMAATAAAEMPTPDVVARQSWLPDDELRVYSDAYAATGFQGGLNWYRCKFVDAFVAEEQLFAGRTLDVPAAFISGAQDWGVWQTPGALDTMLQRTCTDMRVVELIDGAGHWVQQERAERVCDMLTGFLRGL